MKNPLGNDRSLIVLGRLMDPEAAPANWSASDLQSILEHQLYLALEAEKGILAEANGCDDDAVADIIAASGCRTFADAILEAAPPAPAIALVKNYAKRALSRDDILPHDCARVIYLLAVLQGRAAGHPGISNLDSSTLERESRRCLTAGWLPDRVRARISRLLEASRANEPDHG
jgi:hypothetical protein